MLTTVAFGLGQPTLGAMVGDAVESDVRGVALGIATLLFLVGGSVGSAEVAGLGDVIGVPASLALLPPCRLLGILVLDRAGAGRRSASAQPRLSSHPCPALAAPVRRRGRPTRGAPMPEFMDVHTRMKGVTPEALLEAHNADLAIQGRRVSTSSTPGPTRRAAMVWCLSEAPTRRRSNASNGRAPATGSTARPGLSLAIL